MAYGSVSLFLVSFLIILQFISASHESNGLGSEHEYSYYQYEYIPNNRVRRNAEDDGKLKKTSVTKKPVITVKSDSTQKQMHTKIQGKSSPQENANTTSSISLNFYENVDDNTTEPSNATDSVKAMSFWVNITAFADHQTVTHEMLSNSHRRAATITLPFVFRFYGHSITNITIATGGFLYAGDHVHSWLAATQYIAALMANFDTSLSNASTIQYAYNDTAFIVQWSDVMLKDQKPQGNFTFQIILLKHGDIIFVYKDIPFPVEDIPDDHHPVKVGISDAYVIDRTVFFIRRKTVYEYHRVDMKSFHISNNTAIYFTALPSCIAIESCDMCVSANIGFNCTWCDALHRCSDGYDRHRQDWVTRNCEQLSKETKCSSLASTTQQPNSTHEIDVSTPLPGAKNLNVSNSPLLNEVHDYETSSHGSTGLVSILVIVAFLSGMALWIFYAYKNPQSPSGQILIKYRPNQWRWGGSEARYTAASIHM